MQKPLARDRLAAITILTLVSRAPETLKDRQPSRQPLM
jgi:hypothetical protein